MKYLTNSGLSYFFNKIKAYISSVLPTKTSDLTNDSNFVNSLNNYTSFSWDTPVSGKLNIKVDQTWLGGILTTANTTIPTNTSDLTNDSEFITADYAVPRSGGAVMTGDVLGRNVDDDNLRILGGSSWNSGAQLQLCGKDLSGGLGGTFTLYANSGNVVCALQGTPSGILTWNNKNVAMAEDTIPRSGGSVLTGTDYFKTTNNSYICIGGGTNWGDGATVTVNGATRSSYTGYLILAPNNGAIAKGMYLVPDGTWTWNGTACQITSDQRLKQQIAEIDDKLLDAWQDVNLVQFKYNDAVDQKGDTARLHTGYVVQQIDEACKSHNLDISDYGLYCHEEYPERTEEVTIENEDGTTTKETKVIEEASEHYSLRYTETLVVECAYLRKQIKELKERLEKLEAK